MSFGATQDITTEVESTACVTLTGAIFEGIDAIVTFRVELLSPGPNRLIGYTMNE